LHVNIEFSDKSCPVKFFQKETTCLWDYMLLSNYIHILNNVSRECTIYLIYAITCDFICTNDINIGINKVITQQNINNALT
jgi:hypothetical protein